MTKSLVFIGLNKLLASFRFVFRGAKCLVQFVDTTINLAPFVITLELISPLNFGLGRSFQGALSIVRQTDALIRSLNAYRTLQ